MTKVRFLVSLSLRSIIIWTRLLGFPYKVFGSLILHLLHMKTGLYCQILLFFCQIFPPKTCWLKLFPWTFLLHIWLSDNSLSNLGCFQQYMMNLNLSIDILRNYCQSRNFLYACLCFSNLHLLTLHRLP